MTSGKNLDSLSVASEKVRLQWIVGGVSELVGVPKKHLRKAFNIAISPKIKEKISIKGEIVEKTFSYGFMSYTDRKKKKARKILEPHPDIQKVYRGIKDWLERVVEYHSQTFGFVRGRNSKTAAQELEELFHGGHHISFDIADAFPSITDEMVKAALKKLGVEDAIADFLAWFVTYEYQGKRRLPQGASSSPAILNLVYKPMCEEIDLICRANKIKWSVYADDFNFSAVSISPEVRDILLSIPSKYGFEIKKEKNKDNFSKTIPHLLGLTVVDGNLHITRRQKKKFRQMLYMAVKYKAYSPEVVRGIRGYIKHIYGEEKNWPGWLKKI